MISSLTSGLDTLIDLCIKVSNYFDSQTTFGFKALVKMPGIEYKSIGTGEMMLKDIDEKKGRVLGYFSKFGNVDSDGDMIMPGSFTKTLKENGHRIKHLYQ